MLTYLKFHLVMFVAYRFRRLGRGLVLIRRPLQERGWWTAAAGLYRVQQQVEKVGEWLVLSYLAPQFEENRDNAIVVAAVSRKTRARFNNKYEQLCLRSLAAHSNYAWTPAGVGALVARSFPAGVDVEVARGVEADLSMWAAHNEGVFEER